MKASPGWILCSVLLSAACAGPHQNVATGAAGINVELNCPGAVSATITPWRQQVTRGDSVVWSLRGQASSLSITPDSGSAWPFANPDPSGDKQKAASSGAMTGNPASGTVIRYTMTIRCDTITVVIDPELIIT